MLLAASMLAPAWQVQADGCNPQATALETLVGQVGEMIIGDEPCSVKAALDEAALKHNLPAELVYAAAWSQSRWQHWSDSDELTGNRNAPGLFRISKQVWSKKYDWKLVEDDLAYHADAGVEILADAHDLVKRRTGWSGDKLMRAAYAVFVGGPRQMNSPWNGTGPKVSNARFDTALNTRPWEATLTEECAVERVVLDDSRCTVKKLLDELAVEFDLPAELLYSVAWTESNWTQWTKYDRPLHSRGGDHGLMQINVQHRGRYNFRKIDWDLEYNARAGAEILRYSVDVVKRKGYKGKENIWRAAYAVYNGGPRLSARPWKNNDPRDANFFRHMTNKPWKNRIRGCDAKEEASVATK